jgi:hypothetical protein
VKELIMPAVVDCLSKAMGLLFNIDSETKKATPTNDNKWKIPEDNDLMRKINKIGNEKIVKK